MFKILNDIGNTTISEGNITYYGVVLHLKLPMV